MISQSTHLSSEDLLQWLSLNRITLYQDLLTQVDNMIYMNSVSSGSGKMTINITFAIGSDPDQARKQSQAILIRFIFLILIQLVKEEYIEEADLEQEKKPRNTR